MCLMLRCLCCFLLDSVLVPQSGCQEIYASFYSTPTLCGSERDGQIEIIMVNETRRWWKEVTGRKERCRIKKRGTEGAGEQGRACSCQGINVSLQPSSVTSATKSPSNCYPVPKHLANAQLMSTDAVGHWLLVLLSADRLVRPGGRNKTEKKRTKQMRERGGITQQNEDNCTY